MLTAALAPVSLADVSLPKSIVVPAQQDVEGKPGYSQTLNACYYTYEIDSRTNITFTYRDRDLPGLVYDFRVVYNYSGNNDQSVTAVYDIGNGNPASLDVYCNYYYGDGRTTY